MSKNGDKDSDEVSEVSTVSSIDMGELNKKLDIQLKYIGKKYLNIVLSGGGSKGLSTLGSLQYIYDNDMIDHDQELNFIGTSIGGVIAYLLIIGYKPMEIFVNLCTSDFLGSFQYGDILSMTQGSGSFDWTVINQFLEKLTLQKIGKFLTMKDLKLLFNKNLTLVTYNLTEHKKELISGDNEKFKDVPCLTALRMSSNVPIIFSQFKYFDCEYIDGGFIDNLATGVIENELNTIAISTHTRPHYDPEETFKLHHYFLKLFLENQLIRSAKTVEDIKEKEHIDLIHLDFLGKSGEGRPGWTSGKLTVSNSQAVNMFSTAYRFTQKFYCN